MTRLLPSHSLLLLWLLMPGAARALDKQGSAHGGHNEGAAEDGVNLSGSVSLGASAYNPSYAARPDNSGLALLRYAAHFDLDLIGQKLSLPIDLNFFTDRLRSGFQKIAPTEFDVIGGVTSTWALGPGSLESGVRVEHDRPIDRGTFTQTYVDARARYLYSLAALVPRLAGWLHDGDIHGWLTAGWFVFNPSYAARPDNTGLGLFRYAVHLEVSVLHNWIAFAGDTTFFTDRSASNVFRASELDLTVEVIGRFAPVELHLAYERDMPMDRGGLIQSFVYLLASYSFDLRAARVEAHPAHNQAISP